MFYGENLKNVRELKSLSRKELAQLVGVTEQAIWQYENQKTVPNFEIFKELEKIFSVKPQFFYSKNFISKISDIEHIAYRSSDREARKKAKIETIYLDFIDYFIDQFERYIEPSTNLIDDLSKDFEDQFNRIEPEGKKEVLKEIAKKSRIELGLKDNNKDLMYKLEMAGIFVIEKQLGSKIDAYSTWTEDNKAFIILGNINKTAVRRNFDLAHELGHLLIHRSVDLDSLSKDEYRQIETEANDFASYFLMPEKNFVEDFKLITKRSNPYSYLEMKMKYLVPIASLEYRAYKLGLLTYEENRYFYAYLNRHHLRQHEPLDDDIKLVRPGKVRALINFVFENRLISLDQLLEEHNLKISFLASLLDIEESFFDKFKNQSSLNYYDSKFIQLFPNKN